MAKLDWYWFVIPLVIIGGLWYYSQAQTLAPLNTITDCSAWGKAGGVCIGNEGSSTSSFSLFRDPYIGYSGTDAYTWRETTSDVASLNSAMSVAGVGIGSSCEVQLNLQTCILMGTSSNIFDGCYNMAANYYPAGAPQGSWQQGQLIANPTASTKVSYYLYSNTGNSYLQYAYKPYICRTAYNYPSTITGPSQITISGKAYAVTAIMFREKVRIYTTGTCITRDVLGGYINQWIAGTITRDSLGGYIMQWVNC